MQKRRIMILVLLQKLSIPYVKGNKPHEIRVIIILIDNRWKLINDNIIDLEKEKSIKK